MNIVFMRSNPINPYPRAEKEISALIEGGHTPYVLAWNRDFPGNQKVQYDELNLEAGNAPICRFNIKAEFCLGIKNLLPLVRWNLTILKWLFKNRKKYDVIHAYDFDTVLPALIMKKVLKKKYIYDICDYYLACHNIPVFLKKYIKWLDHCSINNSSATILVNEFRANQILGSNPQKLVFIHNTPPKVEFEIEEPAERNRRRIFFGGLLSRDRLIEETINICKRHDDWEFVIAGDGPLQKKCETASKEMVNVTYLGKIPYREILLNTYLSDVIFACYDSRSRENHKYSSPNKFYEALMCGKPIIVCEGTGIDEIVSKHRCGFVCEYNEQSFEKALKNVLDDPDRASLIRTAAFQLYQEKYSWDVMKARLLNLYRNL